jgi:hypothetical protein
MNRRHYIGATGTAVVSSVGVWAAYQLDQGNISLGEDSDISETVSRSPETVEFDVLAGTEIRVSVRDTGSESAPYTGSFTLQDPHGNDVLTGGPRSSETTMETHTAELDGTYRLIVNPQNTRLIVNIFLQEQGE